MRPTAVIHALLSLQAETTACGETPPRGLGVADDHQEEWYLSSIAPRCERCRVELHLRRARIQAARKPAARATQLWPETIPSARDRRRAAQAKEARDRSIEQYAARSRSRLSAKGSP